MIHNEEITYYDGTDLCCGFIAYKKDDIAVKPCVLIAHDWGGRSQQMCEKAIELAKLGYVGFAVDVYGEKQLGQDKVENRALMTPFVENRQLVKSRMLAAFYKACDLPMVDKKQIAVMGYCFGGLCALDLARTGCDIKGAISFHGNLLAAKESEYESIKSKILILHGYQDALVPNDQLASFAAEMTKRHVDWQIYIYGQAHHSFTNPSANDPELGLFYDKKADYRSWQSLVLFLKEIFTGTNDTYDTLRC